MQERDMMPSLTEVCGEEKFMEAVRQHTNKILPLEGYRNRGNTCYVNSVLQCLLKGTPLGSGIASPAVGAHDCKKDKCLVCALKRVFLQGDQWMQQMMTSILTTIKGIAQYRQEDAHEFYRSLVDHIHESYVRQHIAQSGAEKVPGLEQTSFPYRLLSGWMQQKTVCSGCRNISTVYQPFIDLSIPIADVSTLEQGLHGLTKPEEFPGYMCEKCGVETTATKQSVLHRSPSVLVVQLQRFHFKSLYSSKISKKISYPVTLDMSNFMAAPSCDSNQYTLTALLIHVGETVNFGHYISIVAHNGHWFRYNDSVVNQIPGDRVTDFCPYLLFYTRSDLLQKARSREEIEISTQDHRKVVEQYEKARQLRARKEREEREERQNAERQKLYESQKKERQLHASLFPKKQQPPKVRSTSQVKNLWKTAPPPLIEKSLEDSKNTRVSPLKMQPKPTITPENNKRRSSMREVIKKPKREEEFNMEDPPESPTTSPNNHAFLFDFGRIERLAPISKIVSRLEDNGFEAEIIASQEKNFPMYLGIFKSYPPDCRNRIRLLERIFQGWQLKITMAQESMLMLFKLPKKSDDTKEEKRNGVSNAVPSLTSVELPLTASSTASAENGHSKLPLPNLRPGKLPHIFCGPEEDFFSSSPPRQPTTANRPTVPMGAQDPNRLDRDLELLDITPERNKTTPTSEDGSPDSLLNLQSTYDESQPELRNLQLGDQNGEPKEETKIDILHTDSSDAESPLPEEVTQRVKRVVQLANESLDLSQKPILEIQKQLSESGLRWFSKSSDSNIRKKGKIISEQISTLPLKKFSALRASIVRDLVKLVYFCMQV